MPAYVPKEPDKPMRLFCTKCERELEVRCPEDSELWPMHRCRDELRPFDRGALLKALPPRRF